MVRDLTIRPHLWVKQKRKVEMKDNIMNTQPQCKTPTPAEVQKIIHQAHQMRSDYIAKSIKVGLSKLHGIFANKKPLGNATA